MHGAPLIQENSENQAQQNQQSAVEQKLKDLQAQKNPDNT